MWEPRRVFWTNILERGWISASWPILSREGYNEAKRLAKIHDNKNFERVGRTSDLFEDQKCYFVMTIGRLTVVEGSHSFALRFFKDGNKSATKIFLNRYNYADLAVKKPPADERITHNQGWENLVESYLQSNR